MKIHRILLSLAPLAAIPGTAQAVEPGDYHAYMETDAATPAYILSSTPYTDLNKELYKDEVVVDDNKAYRYNNFITATNSAFTGTAFFNSKGASVSIISSSLTATEGSMIIDGIQFDGGTVTANGVSSETWGLPQIALANVKFLDSTNPTKFATNYCTFKNWEAVGGNAIELTTKSGATLTNGTVQGATAISADKAVKLDGLSISNGATLTVDAADTAYLAAKPDHSDLGAGTLVINAGGKVKIGESPSTGEKIHTLTGNLAVNYTGEGGGEGIWDVDVVGGMNGTLTVNATLGRVNAGILSGTGTITAKDIYLTSFNGSTLTLKANQNVMLKDSIEAENNLRVTRQEADGEYADISFEGSLKAANWMILEGNRITGGGSATVLAADHYLISAEDYVNIAGTFQGGKMNLYSEGAVTLGALGDAENPMGYANISSKAGAPVNIGSFTGETLSASASGAVDVTGNLAATGEDMWFPADSSGKYAVVLEGTSVSIGGSLTGSEKGKSYIESTGGDITISGALSSGASATLKAAGDITILGQAHLIDSTLSANAVNIPSLISGGTNLIQIDPESRGMEMDTLCLEGGSLTLESAQENGDKDVVVKKTLAVSASTVLSANLVLNDGTRVTYAADAVLSLGGSLTLMGDMDIVLWDGHATGPATLMQGVEELLDADGKSIELSWKQYSDQDVWYTELYEVRDAQGVHYSTNAAGGSLSQLSLIYDRAMAANQEAAFGRLIVGSIPEPATSTLSLLALAALAARRRRKQ